MKFGSNEKIYSENERTVIIIIIIKHTEGIVFSVLVAFLIIYGIQMLANNSNTKNPRVHIRMEKC